MRRPAAGCSTLLLLLLALDAAQRQVLAAQLAVQLPLTDAGSAAAQTGAGAAFSERTPSEAAATGREQVAASQKASDQPGFTADCQDRCSDLAQQASPSQFQHPLAPPQQRAGRLVEAQAHVDMQRWLGSFFNSNASRLTSTRLQEARAARAAANASTAAAAAPGPEEASAAEGVADVVAPAGMRRCDAECLRAAAEEVLLAREQPGRALQLRWQPFEEDRQRWAPQAGHGLPARRGVRPAQDACQLRQPDETISRDFLVIAAVGNNWDTVNGWVGGQTGGTGPWVGGAPAAAGSPTACCWPHHLCLLSSLPASACPHSTHHTPPRRWMSQPGSATFDVVLLHYGNDTTLDCPACAAVLRMAGPKWMLVWQLTQHPAWPRLAAGRRAVMVADDDVVLDTCSINRCGGHAARTAGQLHRLWQPAGARSLAWRWCTQRGGQLAWQASRCVGSQPCPTPWRLPRRAFEVFDAYGLLLGQPSLCPTRHRPSWYLHLVRDSNTLLRFATMVEIMVGWGGWVGARVCLGARGSVSLMRAHEGWQPHLALQSLLETFEMRHPVLRPSCPAAAGSHV